MILLLHHRYRHKGGEERAVADLEWLIPTHLDEPVTTVQRDSDDVGARQAARGLLTGGIDPDEVARAAGRARIVHAHNIHPTFGHRALRAAREAGAAVVLHLHNYRLVCANGVCFTHDGDCTRCSATNTLPGVRLNCRGGSRAESAVYGAGLALQQRRITAACDAFIVPSGAARDRLLELRAPIDEQRTFVVPSVQRDIAERSPAAGGEFVLAAGRLTPEKGFADVVDASLRAGRPLVVAGDGPEREALERRGRGEVRFVGRIAPDELRRLRERAAVAVIPSRYHEILPLAALEAMAAGLPTIAAASGGLKDAVPPGSTYPPGDVAALAQLIDSHWADAEEGERALARARELSAPENVASRLREVYDAAVRRRTASH